jgi:hypothetical protein
VLLMISFHAMDDEDDCEATSGIKLESFDFARKLM